MPDFDEMFDQPTLSWQERKDQSELTRLRAEVEDLTADRDSWIEQASARTADAVQFMQERDAARAEVEALRADAEKKDALLVRAHDMLGYIGCSPEGASNDVRMAEELQRDIDAARAAQGELG